jgi:hypothetical protein
MKDITAILNVYRRTHTLASQIEALRSQTHPPKAIWVMVTEHEDNKDYPFDSLDIDALIHVKKHDFKYHGRFALALLAQTEHIAILDDDSIPGSKWFENCQTTMEDTPGILGTYGVKFRSDIYDVPGYMWQHESEGWNTKRDETVEVDFIGQSWFFQREDLNYLWREVPYCYTNAEDMQFSYLAKKYGNVNSYCPPHPESDKEMWGSLQAVELGDDEVASSQAHSDKFAYFCQLRNEVLHNAIKNGWNTIYEVKPSEHAERICGVSTPV